MGVMTEPVIPTFVVNGEAVPSSIVTVITQGEPIVRTIIVATFDHDDHEPWVALCEYAGDGAGSDPQHIIAVPAHIWTDITGELVRHLED